MFFKAWKITKSGLAKHAVELINKLFALEKLRDQEDFFNIRKREAVIIFNEFKIWLDAIQQEVPPKSELGRALSYTLDNWPELILYIDHPLLTPSNNIAESIIRLFVICRKNWIFSASPQGAQASGTLYSLIESAKLNDLNPYLYLRYIFTQLPYTNTREGYAALLPYNLKNSKLESFF